MVPTASGRKRGSSRISAAKAMNNPFPVIPMMKPGPPPSLSGDETRTAMARMIGTTASTRHPGQVAPPAEDDLELRGQEARRDPGLGRRPLRRGRPAPQPLTSKPSPVSPTNTSSRLGCNTAKPSTGTQAFTRFGTIFSTATSPSSAVT